jgi:hypothetical protein
MLCIMSVYYNLLTFLTFIQDNIIYYAVHVCIFQQITRQIYSDLFFHDITHVMEETFA